MVQIFCAHSFVVQIMMRYLEERTIGIMRRYRLLSTIVFDIGDHTENMKRSVLASIDASSSILIYDFPYPLYTRASRYGCGDSRSSSLYVLTSHQCCLYLRSVWCVCVNVCTCAPVVCLRMTGCVLGSVQHSRNTLSADSEYVFQFRKFTGNCSILNNSKSTDHSQVFLPACDRLRASRRPAF